MPNAGRSPRFHHTATPRRGLRRALSAGLVTATLAGSLAGTGCITASPWVNIPPQEGDALARHDVNARNVRDAVAVGLNAVLARRPLEGRAELRLPADATDLTYADLALRGSQGLEYTLLTPYDVGASGESSAVVEVTGVRLRGTKGSIDVVRPGRGGIRQLATADLRYAPGSGWSVKDVRFLNAPVNDQTLYPAGTPVEPDPTPADLPAPTQAPADVEDAPPPADTDASPT